MAELLSLIIPCFNEEKTISLFYQEVMHVINQIDMSYELIFVNDGSKDQTIHEIKVVHKLDPNVKLISFSRNFGKEAAMLAGLEYCSGDYVAIIDADLQHPPVLLLDMLKYMKEDGYDAVGAYRLSGTLNDSVLRSMYSKLFYKFINKMSDVRIKENSTDYRLMKRKVVNAVLSLKEYNRFSKGIFEWVGFHTKYIGYENVNRVAGKSTWNFFTLLNYALEGITSFSVIPLRLSSYLGILSAFVSFLYMTYVIFDKLINNNAVSGWATIVSLILFLGGIMLISLGLLGEYIGRIYGEVKKRPQYIIDEIEE